MKEFPSPESHTGGLRPSRWLLYSVACIASVVVAYIIAVVAGALLTIANITSVVAAFVGVETAFALVELAGNLVFAGAVGVLVAVSWESQFHRTEGDLALVVLGAVGALAFTFGFPAFAQSYLPDVAEWLVTEGAGLPRIIALSVLEAVLVGSLVAATGWTRPAGALR